MAEPRESTAAFLERTRRALQAARRQRVERARVDVNWFCEHVLRDDVTGEPVRQARIHQEWQDLAQQNNRLVLWGFTGSAKSTQLAVGRTLWKLGRDPSLRVAVLAGAEGQTAKTVRVIANYVEHSPELREVFPHLVPGAPWSPDAGEINVARRTMARDLSVQAFGLHSKDLLSARFDDLIVDDILNFENTRTPHQRKATLEYLRSDVVSRLTERANVLVLANAYHREDAPHVLATQPGWVARRYPVMDEVTGELAWPDKWPRERIEQRRNDLSNPVEFARQMMCRARSDEDARFKREWVERALALGNGLELVHRIGNVPPGARAITGVDLAVQKHQAADLTAFVDTLVRADAVRQLLSVESGRLHGPDIVRAIHDHRVRYGSVFWVENVAAQDYIRQFAAEVADVVVNPFTTGRGEASLDFQAEHLAGEMSAGKWAIPNRGGVMHPEVEALVNDMLYYDPRGHCGDRLAALLMCRYGAAQEPPGKINQFRIDLLRR